MFSTLKLKLLLGVYIFLVVSIPMGSYLASQSQTTKSSASQSSKEPIVKVTPKPISSPAKDLLNRSQVSPPPTGKPSPTPQPSTSQTIATSFGPTLSLKANLEARPKDNQAIRLFIGIMEGSLTINPKFLLTFSVNLPKSGEYSGLSLAGLTPGNKFTALLKGSAQIATSSAFFLSPNVTNLNDGQALNMLSGDLNEDNAINSSDYSIVKALLGATSKSSNWNENADFNKDGIINSFDLAIVTKNLGKVGASGAWTSPIPKTATKSGELILPVGSAMDGTNEGYWLWIPK